jgi:hypothetical protein
MAGRYVVAVNWTSTQLVLAESDGTTEAGSFFTYAHRAHSVGQCASHRPHSWARLRLARPALGAVLCARRIMPLPTSDAAALPATAAIVVRSQFPIQPNYLDLFSTDSKTLVFASMESTLGSVCAKCPMYVASRRRSADRRGSRRWHPLGLACSPGCVLRYNTFCVDVPNGQREPVLQFQMHADACTGAPSTPTPAHAHHAQLDVSSHTKHAIFRPQGILYGGRGPFLVCSNGRDALWYHFSARTEAGTLKPEADQSLMPYTTTLLRLADVPAKHGKPSQGCRKVFFAGTKLVDLWTDFHDKQRTLTVMEPTSKLIDTMGLDGELCSLAHGDCIHGRLPSAGQPN